MRDMPKVTGSPESIYLVYGDLSEAPEDDFTHGALTGAEDSVTWCEQEQFSTDVKYIRADLADEAMAALRGLVEAHAALIKAYLKPDELTVFRLYCRAWENARRVAGVERSK